MAVTTTTANMGLVLPVVGIHGQVGPTWATNIDDAFTVLDSHNHTLNNGVRIPTAGLNINAELSINGNNLIQANSLRMVNLPSVLSSTYDKGCFYEVNGDFYYNNASGTPIQITSGSGINLSTIGTIGGDYSTTPGVTLSYSNATKVFSFKQSATLPAKIACGDISLYEIVPGGNAITLKAPLSLGSSYTLTMPTVLPATTLPVCMDATGNLGTQQIITSQIADANVTLDKLSTNAQATLNPAGAIMDFAGASAPIGWLLCNGASISTTTYAALFAVIGYIYGGSGASFNVPDARGRFTIGVGSGPGLTSRTLASAFGNETHSHSVIPHNHQWYQATGNNLPDKTYAFNGSLLDLPITSKTINNGGTYAYIAPSTATGDTYNPVTVSSLGSSYTSDVTPLTTTVNMMNPSIAFNKIIKY